MKVCYSLSHIVNLKRNISGLEPTEPLGAYQRNSLVNFPIYQGHKFVQIAIVEPGKYEPNRALGCVFNESLKVDDVWVIQLSLNFDFPDCQLDRLERFTKSLGDYPKHSYP